MYVYVYIYIYVFLYIYIYPDSRLIRFLGVRGFGVRGPRSVGVSEFGFIFSLILFKLLF